ncbi:hypothetical protein ZIOFF_002957 [Zingiber officinale]|uniref:Uncharacterized protein n=1 Tax=Zingiber officinale TaxID=94328 RepID=A0A8J5LT25_ZINOF|nr:hypothetical protein ZIOFF_002957 [Zingiber officinale]
MKNRNLRRGSEGRKVENSAIVAVSRNRSGRRSSCAMMAPDAGAVAANEEKCLSDAIGRLQHNAFYMHRALDSKNLKDALKYAGEMLSELRTSSLSPHKYYDLCMSMAIVLISIIFPLLVGLTDDYECFFSWLIGYGNVKDMRAFDELRKVEMFFTEETRRGSYVVTDLYELVQHASNILPRLYLLCTVGSVYIKSKEAPAKDVLKDLVEMCHAIQHPVRGLFLRSYLSQISKDKLPDISSEYEGCLA